jgi:hypothetical protein
VNDLIDTISAPGAAGWYGLACLLVAAVGFCMMVINVVRGQSGRIWPAGLLLAGIAYAVVNVVVFVVTLSTDRFAIFARTYVVSAALVGPALMIIIVAGFSRRLGWLGVLGYAIWIGCVGFAHLWIVAQASASV